MINKLKQLLLSSRPLSWVNTAYPFAAGYIMTQRSFNLILIIGSLYFLIPYNLLMYGLNDVFDYESDLVNQRKGGLQGAVLNKSIHLLTIYSSILINIPFLIYLYAVGNLFSAVILTFIVFMVLAYSLPKLRFKERPILDSFTSSCHFMGPLLFAFSLVGFNSFNIVIIISFVFWGMASHAFGAVQDIIADKKAKIKSIATVLGAKKTVRLSILFYILSGLILLFDGRTAAIVGLIDLFYIFNILPYRNVTDKLSETANNGWKRFLILNYVCGFLLTMYLITTYNHLV